LTRGHSGERPTLEGDSGTRWREDTTRDNWGSFCYVRDLASGNVWSIAYQPTLERAALRKRSSRKCARRSAVAITGLTATDVSISVGARVKRPGAVVAGDGGWRDPAPDQGVA
jgi:hypothetical protein